MLHQISSLLLVLLTLLHLHLHLYQTLNLLIHLIHKHLHLANLLELKKLQIISITITIITSPVSLLHLNLYNITWATIDFPLLTSIMFVGFLPIVNL